MASSLTSLPAPGSAEAGRAEVKAAFIRETSARILAALIAEDPDNPALAAVMSFDAAVLLAKHLENKGYL